MDRCGKIIIPSNASNVCMDEWNGTNRVVRGNCPEQLRAAIRAVYRNGVLKPYETEKRIQLPNGYYANVYILPMVVAIAFRINSPSANMIRNALLERLCFEKKSKSYGHSCTTMRMNVSMSARIDSRTCTRVYVRTCDSPKKCGIPLLRAFSFRHFKNDIIRYATFSYLSVSFASFCIVLRIKVLIVLP